MAEDEPSARSAPRQISDSEQRVLAILERVEANQREALELHKRQLELALEQTERNQIKIDKSIEMQRAAVERVRQSAKFILPVIAILLLLLAFLLVRYAELLF